MVELGMPLINEIINNFLLSASEIFIYSIAIAIYAILIWYYYRLLARRDFFYFENIEAQGFMGWVKKFFSEIAFILKYIIFFPLISFIFFTAFSIMLFLLSKNQTIQEILFIGTAVIAATRITAYYNEDLSKDLAKMVPLALLGVFVVQTNFFSLDLLYERVMTLPNFAVQIGSFILFFLVLEIGLRIIYGFISVNKSDKLKRHEKFRNMREIKTAEKVSKEARDELLNDIEKAL